MTLQNNCSDINFKIIEYLDVMDLTAFSTSCKSMNKDSTLYLNKFKKTNMSNYIDKHTCRNCLFCSNEVEKNFCNDCFLYKCDNCFGVKNEMTEFVKYVNMNNLSTINNYLVYSLELFIIIIIIIIISISISIVPAEVMSSPNSQLQ